MSAAPFAGDIHLGKTQVSQTHTGYSLSTVRRKRKNFRKGINCVVIEKKREKKKPEVREAGHTTLAVINTMWRK